jgi:uncharacterized iron-regulated membrane protein
MKQFRQLLFWTHLVVGVTAAAVILLMSVTGVLLTYEKQIASWADTRGYEVAKGPERLAPEALLAKVREAEPAPPSSLTVRSDPAAPASLGYSGGRTLYVDPYTGAVLGEGSKGARSFFRTMTDWHRWLGASGENRAVGRAITGACNLGFLFLVASGFYLWWPRNWTPKAVRNVTWFRRGLSGKARDFNWHNVIGLWSAVPLFVVVLSGVVISYSWAGNLVYRAVGEEPPPPRGSGPPRGAEAEAAPSADGLDPLLARAEQQVEGWRTISLQLPKPADAAVTFSIDTGSGGEPQKRSSLTLDRATGEVAKWEPFSSLSAGRQLRSILRFAHTGEVAGVFGQTVAGIVSAGGAVLVWTGIALAWRRFRAWRARTQREPAVSAAIAARGEEA